MFVLIRSIYCNYFRNGGERYYITTVQYKFIKKFQQFRALLTLLYIIHSAFHEALLKSDTCFVIH